MQTRSPPVPTPSLLAPNPPPILTTTPPSTEPTSAPLPNSNPDSQPPPNQLQCEDELPEDHTCDSCLSLFQATNEQAYLTWFRDNDNLLCPECKPEHTEEEENLKSLSVEIKENELSFVSRYGLGLSDATAPNPTGGWSCDFYCGFSHPDFKTVEEHEKTCSDAQAAQAKPEFKCESCTSWFDLASEGITTAMLRDRVFEKLYCTECKMTAKINSSPINPLRAKPKEASATINPQPLSPTSSPFPSTSHNSKPVSSPHSDIIPMAQEQISPVVQNGDKIYAMCQPGAKGKRKTIRKQAYVRSNSAR